MRSFALEGNIIDEHLARAVAQPSQSLPVVHHVFQAHNQELPIEHHFIYHAPPTGDHDYRFQRSDLTTTQTQQQHSSDYHRELYPNIRQDGRFSTTSNNSPNRLAVPKQPAQQTSNSSASSNASNRSHRSGSSTTRNHHHRSSHDNLDQAQVEEQVARNVSNILSASLSLQAAAAAAAASGPSAGGSSASAGGAAVGLSPGAKRQHICADCQRAVSSQRNLVRHRQSCKAVLANSNNASFNATDKAEQARNARFTSHNSQQHSGRTECGSAEEIDEDDALMESVVDRLSSHHHHHATDELGLISPEGLDSRMLEAIGMPIRDDDRLSRTPSPSPLADTPTLRRKSLQMTIGSSAGGGGGGGQHSSSSSTGNNNSAPPRFVCEACSRIVSSQRSLKRHRGTCKQYSAWEVEHGSPSNEPKSQKEDITSNSGITVTAPPIAVNSCVIGQQQVAIAPSPMPVTAVATACNNSLSSSFNICEHCNRQLCSSSNLKRHLVTCKAMTSAKAVANGGAGGGGDDRASVTSPSSGRSVGGGGQLVIPAMADHERSILDRSFAAALAASGATVAALDGVRPIPRRSSSDTLSIPSQDLANLSAYGEENSRTAMPTAVFNAEPKEDAIRLHNLQAGDGLVCVSSGTAPPMTPTIVVPAGSIVSTNVNATEQRFECPECGKTYSCKKNVKRHRMAVHKLDSDAMNRAGEVRMITVPVTIGGGKLSSGPNDMSPPQNSSIHGDQSETPSMRDHYSCSTCGASFYSGRMMERHRREECPGLPRDQAEEDAAAVLAVERAAKRERHEAMDTESCDADSSKKSVAELAEADTTFNEDSDDYRPMPPCTSAAVDHHLPLSAPLQMQMSTAPLPSSQQQRQMVNLSSHHHQSAPHSAHLSPNLINRLTIAPTSSMQSYVSTASPPGNGFSAALPPISSCQMPMQARPYQVQPLPPPPQYHHQHHSMPNNNGGGGYGQQLPARQMPSPIAVSTATVGGGGSTMAAGAPPMRYGFHQLPPRPNHPQAHGHPMSAPSPISNVHHQHQVTQAQIRPPPPPPQSHQSQPPPPSHSQPTKRAHTCTECNRTLSSDYSLKRHRNTCPEVKSAEAKGNISGLKTSETVNVAFDNSKSSQSHQTSAFNPVPGITAAATQQSLPLLHRRHSPIVLPSANQMATATTTRLRQFSGTTIHVIEQQQAKPTAMSANGNNGFGKVDSSTNGQQPPPSLTETAMNRQSEQPSKAWNHAPVAVDPDSTTMHNQNSGGESAQCSPTAMCSPGSSTSTGGGGMKREHSDEPMGMTSSGGSSSNSKLKHLCQDCGKFYSSEWNLERHRRESCPMRSKKARVNGASNTTVLHSDLKESPPVRDNESWVEDLVLTVGETRLNLCRTVVSQASQYFNQLFRYYESHTEVPMPVQVDPTALQNLIGVLQNKQQLNDRMIDNVIFLADRLKFRGIYDKCVQYISEKLPSVSVMHAIRLAEQYRLGETKQKLFESISIDVFRSLAADEDYRQMGAELKAELLEKWGTFL